MLATREQQWAWDLRAAWAGGWQVALVMDEDCSPRRLKGFVARVVPTGAYALLEAEGTVYHVPCASILTVRRPHFHEDGPPSAPARLRPQKEELPPGQLALFEENRSEGWTPTEPYV